MEITRDRPLSQEEQKLYLNRCNDAIKHELDRYKIEKFEIPSFECFKVFDMIDRGRKKGDELAILKEKMVKSIETESNVIENDSNIIPNILWDNVTLHQNVLQFNTLFDGILAHCSIYFSENRFNLKNRLENHFVEPSIVSVEMAIRTRIWPRLCSR